MKIIFDNPSGEFDAGQVVSGRVQFVVTKKCQLDGVNVQFLGMAGVRWEEQESMSKHIQTPHASKCNDNFPDINLYILP